MRHTGETGLRPPCGCDAGHLTNREIEVLQLVAAGLRSSEIARTLRISPRTVDDHLRVMRLRVGASDRGELIARCYAAEILLPGWPPRWSGRRCPQICERSADPSPHAQETVFRTRSVKGLCLASEVPDNPVHGRFPDTSVGIGEAQAAGWPFPETAKPPEAVLIGYARAPARDQDLARQISVLTAAGCSAIFADNNGQRVELLRLLGSAHPGGTLVVTSLDRLSDSLRDLVLLLADLRCRGIELESLHEHLDTTAPGGQLIFHAFGALAEFLRQVIAQRTRHGLAAARARGIAGGRPTVMTPERIAAARALLPESTITATAHQLGISRSTLYAHMEVLRSKHPDGQRDRIPADSRDSKLPGEGT